eukprot:jgi/Psemu1/282533/fgenesh1_pg.9_\
MAVPSWKKRAEKRRPDLDSCIEQLQLLSDEKSKSIKSLGQFYVAALGLLYHLRLDQKTIFSLRQHRQSKEDVEPIFPKPKEIPAMTAVLHNQSLFRALVSCLKSNSTDGFEASSSSSAGLAPQTNSMFHPGSRKRGLSWDKNHNPASDVGGSNKSLKLAHGQSPMVGKRASGNAMKPQMNIKILVATILYITMEPLDHWPVPIIEAYAEDCFGPRSWVGDPACRLLVENLSLIHRDSVGLDPIRLISEYVKSEADALKVATFYQTTNHRHREPRSATSPILSSQRTSPTPSILDLPRRQRSESLGSQASKKTEYNPNAIRKVAIKLGRGKNNGDESDSGDEEEVAITTPYSKPSNGGDGSSSSSGEDEEMCAMDQQTLKDQQKMSTLSGSTEESLFSSDPPPPGIKLTYPLQQQTLKFSYVRKRYFGQNLELAYQAVSKKLNERLATKSKQNSSLLNCLFAFTSIPNVRATITANLEKWLQSPALSGLARALFSRTVRSMKNANPPLPADLDALDNILRMRLKANQLNAHIENVTEVAIRIPTVTVTKHIYGHILREVLETMDSHDSTFSDHLSMIHAVHDLLPGQLAANGIASALLNMLIKTPDSLKDLSKPQLIRRIQKLIRAIAGKFGSAFDGCAVLSAMLSFEVDSEYLWTIRDEEHKARLMFQCVTLLVDHAAMTQRVQPTGKSVKLVSPTEDDILEARVNTPTNGSKAKKKDELTGAGPAIYSSILDGVSDRSFPTWVKVMRCMLFLEKSDSPTLRKFLSMGDTPMEDVPGWDSEAKRINFCCDYGADVDDEMVWVVVKIAADENKGALNYVALLVLEHMFERCKKNMKPSIQVKDPALILKLYELAEYIPPPKVKEDIPNHVNGDWNNVVNAKNNEKDGSIPRLGYPGMWWRITGLVLIMCGASPHAVGGVALEKFPTLKALIKMITSDRYRFPTVDSDEAAREEQKGIEQTMRDEEAKITEYLFAPPKCAKKKTKHRINDGALNQGPRSSRRQQEKREQELKRQREREEAEAHAEASRRKKMLRTAQKSITIWDPYKGPRKPPKESADLIFSIGELFDLPRVFQRSTEPDFVLTTIGSTTRGAIERAHDWLIPIISFLPETISRLPASASCFLLLRAYGTAGEERAQLHELSAPLLQHVRDSLIGKFGEADAVRAFDLLLTDIASHNPDRRRCARRVLTNAIGKESIGEKDATFSGSNHAWAINLMHVEHSKSILADAVLRLSAAASFERGGNLRYLVLALHKFTKFAKENDVVGRWDFASLFIELVSRRPTVFANALSSYQDLRSLAIQVVVEEFRVYVEEEKMSTSNETTMVHISLCCSGKAESTKVEMPLALLQSSCVLLSIWSEDEKNDMDSAAIEGLVTMLMSSRESDEKAGSMDINENESDSGLASATLLVKKKSAVPVESWVMLAKSRSDFIAKRAALAAPTTFLPRLLLCSGLPRASLLTMIDRLGRLGEKALDMEKIYIRLLVPSASSEWDLGRLGHRREVSRKLFGRISAYSRLYRLQEVDVNDKVSFTFVEWLSRMCQSTLKPTKMKTKKPKVAPAAIYESVGSAKSLFDVMTMDLPDNNNILKVTQMDADTSQMTAFLLFQDGPVDSPPKTLCDAHMIEKFLTEMFEDNKPDIVDKWLGRNYSHEPILKKRKPRDEEEITPRLRNDELSFTLLECYIRLERKVESIASLLVKWIPKLSSSHGSPKFWRVLLADGQKPAFLWDNLISRCLQTWEYEHMTRCRQWILSEGRNEKLDLVKVVRFLIAASTFSAIHVESFVDLPLTVEYVAWGRTEDIVRSATGFALDCLLSSDYEKRLCSRNDPPECLVLLLLIAKLGRNQVQFVSGAIMKRMQSDDEQSKRSLLLCLLRIYAYLPFSMNLGTAALRSNLMKAVELSSDDWLSWRSPLDDSIEDMLETALSNTSSVRWVQSLVELAKKHPLLLLRKLDKMQNAVEKDAYVNHVIVADDKVGIVSGQGLNEPLLAHANGKRLKLFVKHWGYNYTEHTWLTILDVLSAVPDEVLFQCGLQMGLLDFVDAYLRLVLVQSQLRTSSDRLVKLKDRVSEFLGRFKSANLKSFDSWISSSNSGLPSLGTTRNVLLGCGFLSHQEALESVKKAYDPARDK